MTDYTREQQIADIKAAFADPEAHVLFIDEQEMILVVTSYRVYCYDIGSDDDAMTFYLLWAGKDPIIVPMTVS